MKESVQVISQGLVLWITNAASDGSEHVNPNGSTTFLIVITDHF